MSSVQKKPKKPCKTASFKEYMNYYLRKREWSQSQLAVAARLNQPYINRLINGKVNDVSVDIIMCICLPLQLTVPETKDLLSRVQRAFSPALELHDAYQKLIASYSYKDLKGNVQFDAYKGQPVLVFEEFHSQVPIAAMLNFLDIYPVMLPARYYDRVACYTTVYITSNIPLDQQYPEIQKCKMETWHAFLRRIHTVTEFRKGGLIREVSYENHEIP